MNKKDNLALVFPGQGSQKVGMLSDFEQVEVVKDTFASASDVLGYDVWQSISQGPQEVLNLTENTQPIMLASSIAVWRVWQEEGGAAPAFFAGHSLGEWTALVAAECVSFEDALKLVRSRGRYMQEAVPAGEGAMAAIIGLDDEVVESICADIDSGVVSPVNYNSPGQLVIAGSASAVDLAVEACDKAGARKAMRLAVSAPFHTSLMEPAARRLEQEIAETKFVAPKVPVVHNVHAATESDPGKIKSLMVEQIYSPVQWVQCVQALKNKGVDTVVECGPGKVLSGLNKRIDRAINSFSTEKPDLLSKALAV